MEHAIYETAKHFLIRSKRELILHSPICFGVGDGVAKGKSFFSNFHNYNTMKDIQLLHGVQTNWQTLCLSRLITINAIYL